MMRGVFRIFVLLAACGTGAVFAQSIDDLFTAVKIDNLRGVRNLVERGIDPNAGDAAGDPALTVAIRNDASTVAAFLIASQKVDPDRRNNALETPMMLAAYRNRLDLVEKLIARGAQVNNPGWTALHYAASAGNVEIVKLLLEHAAYIDAESPNKTTPLMMAARGKHRAVCDALIEEGADPTLINERELSAAGFALRAGDRELAELLEKNAAVWRGRYPPVRVP